MPVEALYYILSKISLESSFKYGDSKGKRTGRYFRKSPDFLFATFLSFSQQDTNNVSENRRLLQIGFHAINGQLDPYKNIPSVYKKMASIQNEISKLPHDIDSYGLIHSDMHQQNFLINSNDISVLDFEDCQYGFFALDIGIALYHAIWWGLPEDDSMKNDFAFIIIKNFMSGYTMENHLNNFWLKKILMFMLYRQIDALRWHLNYYKPKKLSEVIYNDLFDIYYDFGKNISFIENDVFYENCQINESSFDNIY